MAETRIDALSIEAKSGGKDKLAQEYGKVIDNIQKSTLSQQFKNKDLSGDPTTGTVEAKRFANTESQAYGTARSGGGQKVKAEPVIVAINKDKELINEIEQKDVRLYGYDGLVRRKSAQNQKSMERELERAFFQEAVDGGTSALPVKSKINEIVEEIVQKIETTKNEYIDGVPRDMIRVILDTQRYGEMRDFLDTTVNANVDTGAGEFGVFHGIKIYPSVYLPASTKMVAMVDGTIAQPVVTDLDNLAKFPASNAWHFGIFYSYGTKVTAKELVYHVAGE